MFAPAAVSRALLRRAAVAGVAKTRAVRPYSRASSRRRAVRIVREPSDTSRFTTQNISDVAAIDTINRASGISMVRLLPRRNEEAARARDAGSKLR